MPEVTKSVEVRSKLPSPPLGERVTAEGGRVRRSPWLFSYQTKTERAACGPEPTGGGPPLGQSLQHDSGSKNRQVVPGGSRRVSRPLRLHFGRLDQRRRDPFHDSIRHGQREKGRVPTRPLREMRPRVPPGSQTSSHSATVKVRDAVERLYLPDQRSWCSSPSLTEFPKG